jgi:hypothetical protein
MITTELVTENTFDFFAFMLSQSEKIPEKKETIPEKVYTDLEIACFLNHKEGKMFIGHFLPNDHPLMVSAGLTCNFSEDVGKIISM